MPARTSLIALLSLLGLPGFVHAAPGSICSSICATEQRQCQSDARLSARLGAPFSAALHAANRSTTDPYSSPGLAMQQLGAAGQDPAKAALDERLHDCDSAQQACVASCAAEARDDNPDAAQAGASHGDAAAAEASQADASQSGAPTAQ